jgi:hypothetical protein
MKAINVTTSPTLICPAGYRGAHIIHNFSDEVIYLALDGDPEVTTALGVPVAVGQTVFHEPVTFGPSGPPAIYAIHGGTGNKELRYGNTAQIVR